MKMNFVLILFLIFNCDSKINKNQNIAFLSYLIRVAINNPAPVNTSTLDGKITFITNAFTLGDMGGVAGADSKCNVDSLKPNISPNIYKAFIVSSTRIATSTANTMGTIITNQTDWVLLANTKYYRQDGKTIIFTTNATRLFDVNALTSSTAGTNTIYWTGLKNDWTNTTNNCTNWTSSIPSGLGDYGNGNLLDSNSISVPGPSSCSVGYKLFCIQQ